LTLVLSTLLLASAARAHEVFPAVADMTEADGALTFVVTANLEAFVAGVDLNGLLNTNSSPRAADYDALRLLPPAEMEARLAAFWPEMAAKIMILADGAPVVPAFVAVTIPEVGDPEVVRQSVLTFLADLPPGASAVTVGWDAGFGNLVLRQQGVEEGYTGYLEGGALSDPIPLSGGGALTGWQVFWSYIPLGFDHIVPKGLDHILFVLGLYFLSTQMSPLLWQVSAFTIAHTVTLALGALDIIRVPPGVVEPLIAATIIFVAVENLFAKGLSPWRLPLVFCFGLLHGLGFAGILTDVGLPEGTFLPALIGFNIGVELGQLAVIGMAFALVGYWFGTRPWFRAGIATPASVLIAAMGAWWFLERTVL
jgi:hypothetical protein